MFKEQDFTTPKGSIYYYANCMLHAYKYKFLTVDKITISMPAEHFYLSKIKDFRSPSLDLLQFGSTILIAIPGEAINPYEIMIAPVVKAFIELMNNKLLKKDTEVLLYPYTTKNSIIDLEIMYSGYASVETISNFISLLSKLGARFSTLEIAFDFVGMDSAFGIDESRFKRIDGTYYSKDYRIVHTNYGPQKKDSLIAIYNKEAKLLLDSSATVIPPEFKALSPCWRLEFRIKQENSRNYLELYDLFLSLIEFISKKGERIKKKADSLIGNAITLSNYHYSGMLDAMLSVNYMSNSYQQY